MTTIHRLKKAFAHIAVAHRSRNYAFHYGSFEYCALGCKTWASKLLPEFVSARSRRHAIDFRLHPNDSDAQIAENQIEGRWRFKFAFNHWDSRCNDRHPK